MTFQEWWTNEMGKDYPTGRYIAEQAYQAGRESMRQECVKHFDSKGFVEDHGSNFADEIRSLK
jgi:hypothetical protein